MTEPTEVGDGTDRFGSDSRIETADPAEQPDRTEATDGATASHGTSPGPTETIDEISRGDLVLLGRMPWSSNATFLAEVWPEGSRPDGGLADRAHLRPEIDDAAPDPQSSPADAPPRPRVVYKPHRGERPLWDFPDGLYRREVAAHLLDRALGWDLIPLTVERDGPLGVGSAQVFVEADFEQHYFTLVEHEDLHPQLRRMAAFDIVANNTDRKGGHVLIDSQRHLWGIDNGLSFHAEFKVRTVIWDFAGEPLGSDEAEDLARLVEEGLPDDLARLLDPFERDALLTRARALLSEGRLPHDPTGHRHPWPLV